MKPENEPAEFDKYSEKYGELVSEAVNFSGQEHAFYLKFKARLLLEFLEQNFPNLKTLKILDFGCGKGSMDEYLAPALPGLEGTDVSEQSIKLAMKHLPQVRYTVSAEDHLPYPDETFDVVFAVCVFHHIGRDLRAKIISEHKRLLKPGGFVVIMEHNPLNPGTQLVVNRCELDRDAILLRSGETKRLLEEGGLCVKAKKFFLVFPADNWLTRTFEKALAKLPLGAQYLVAAQKTDSSQK